ncbi:hypothetical protein B0T22DRAFT_84837 [Podospora appendiculata]|uniref:F-box domain-containing protein n=1 Tax=Podospora appendiculata TaxID=314037 RepID=A0AAE0XK18_9PEZI|nr:hypothetical protein B0T22DRAFT_84837 [Podospora appendiculata]
MPGLRFHYFFDLPAELRELILQHICLFPDGILVGGNSHNDAAGPPLDLFLASSRLMREASDIYYGQNTFHFDCRRSRLSQLSAALVDPDTGLLDSLAARPARRRIRAVVVYVRRLGALLGNVVIPALRNMVLDGGLRALDVRVEQKLFCHSVGLVFSRTAERFSPGSLVRGGGNVAAAPPIGMPFRMLLGLLADPYLDSTHVRLLREHRGLAAVCPYHAGDWCKRDLRQQRWRRLVQPPGECASYQEELEGWSCWVDVDVKGLLEVYRGDEPEFRILSVG